MSVEEISKSYVRNPGLVDDDAPSFGEYVASYLFGVPDRVNFVSPSRFDVLTNSLTAPIRKYFGREYPWEFSPEDRSRFRLYQKSLANKPKGDFNSKFNSDNFMSYRNAQRGRSNSRRRTIQGARVQPGATRTFNGKQQVYYRNRNGEGWTDRYHDGRFGYMRFNRFGTGYMADRGTGRTKAQQNKWNRNNPGKPAMGHARGHPRNGGLGGFQTGKFPVDRPTVAFNAQSKVMRGNASKERKTSFMTTKVHAKVFLGDIQQTPGNEVYWLPDGLNNIGGQYYFSPTNGVYTPATGSTVRPNALMYDRYRISSARLEYVPCTGSVTNKQITMCICRAVDHFERVPVGSPIATPTRALILTMPSAVSAPAWQGISVSLESDKKFNDAWLYTASPSGNAIYTFGLPIAAVRESYGFVAGVNITGDVPLATTLLGSMFIYLDIEFSGMAPTLTGAITSMPLSRDEILTLRSLIKGESKGSSREDEGLLADVDKLSIKDDSWTTLRSPKPKSNSVKSEPRLKL